MFSVLDLSTITADQLGFAPTDLYAAILGGLLSVGEFFNGLTGGTIPGPLPTL
jgi:hypothetical protein